MEVRQLRYFLAVAEELHFGRAADRLHMSQPPLSVQVSRLEQEIGTPLFVRSTRRVTLTPAGQHLQTRAQAILRELESVREEMRQYADGMSGKLAAGFVSSANYTVLPGVVQLFRNHRPHIELELVPLTSGEQLERLGAGTLDIGIVRDEVPRKASSDVALVFEVVFEERFVACLPVDHPLARYSEVSTSEIVEVPMISYPRSLMPGYVDRVTEVLGAAPDTIQVVKEVVHQETALGFVAAGLGTTILPESVRQLLPPSIAAVPLSNAPTTQLLAVHPAQPKRPLTETFIRYLHEAARGLEGR